MTAAAGVERAGPGEVAIGPADAGRCFVLRGVKYYGANDATLRFDN